MSYKPRLKTLKIVAQVKTAHHLEDKTIIETDAFTLILNANQSAVADAFCAQGFVTLTDIELTIGDPKERADENM